MKKLLVAVFFILLSFSLMACSGKESVESKESNSETATREWTDSLGRTVEIPSEINKIALSGPNSQIVLYALAPDMLAGFSSDWSANVQQYIPEQYLSLPVLGQLYGGNGEINLEELLASGAQIVIDVGEPKASAKEDLDSLQEQTGIPFVHVTMTIANAGDAFRMLGDLLGIEEKAEKYAEFCEDVYSRALDISRRIDADGKKKNAIYVLGDQGLNVIATGSFHGEVFDLFTNNISVVDDVTPLGSGNEVDMEQILTWNPDWIVFAPDSIYGDVSNMQEWQSVNAIADGNYVKTPIGPYNWMGYPPSVQRYLGLLWLPAVMYPEYVDYDLKDEVLEYYDMFVHCELSDEQYDELTRDAFVSR